MALFIPEVFADALQTEFVGKLVFAGLSFQTNALEGNVGDRVNLPYFDYIGDAAIVAEGVAAVPVNLTGSAITAVVQKAVKAAEITDEKLTQAAGDPMGEIRFQFARSLAAAVDAQLVTTALTTAKVVGDGSAAISTDLIVDAQAALGENGDNAVLVINSKQRATLYKDANFVDASKLGAPVMVGGLQAIGMLFGMPVVVSDRIADGTAIVMVPGALALGYKKAPIVEMDRDILKGSTIVAANVHFATALARPNNVVKLNVLA